MCVVSWQHPVVKLHPLRLQIIGCGLELLGRNSPCQGKNPEMRTMNKLLALAAVAVVAISMTGCRSPWTWFTNRGAECDTCNGAPVINDYAPGIVEPEQLRLPPPGRLSE
jgi:hypothetical protein